MRVVPFFVAALLVVPPLALRERPLRGRDLVAAVTSSIFTDDNGSSPVLCAAVEAAGFGTPHDRGDDLDGNRRRRVSDNPYGPSWSCWRFRDGLVVAESFSIIRSEHRLQILDPRGQRVGERLHGRFGVDFRSPDSEAPFPRVELERSIHAVTSRGFVLVRTVGHDKDWKEFHLARASFYSPPTWTLERLIAALTSSDVVDQLEALTWLSAKFETVSDPAKPLRTPEVVKRLHELEASENAWVREAAKLAFEEP